MKASYILLSTVLIFSLAACSAPSDSSGAPPVSQPASSASAESNSATPPPSPSSPSAPSAPSAASSDADALQLFEDGLSNLGISYSERVTMAAEYIGGKSGYKYKCDGYNIELYQFDPESPAYSQAESEGTVTMEGFGDFPVYAHDGMVLIQNDSLPQQVVDLFNSL